MESSSSKDATFWIERLFHAWREKDFSELSEIFRHCEFYMEDPFYPTQHSISDILSLWEEIRDQENLALSYDVLSEAAAGVTYRWKATFESGGSQYILDGIYFVKFDSQGRCKEFYQWTVEKE